MKSTVLDDVLDLEGKWGAVKNDSLNFWLAELNELWVIVPFSMTRI